MKTKLIILGIALLGFILQSATAPKVDDWFNENAVLDIFHIMTSPNDTWDEIVSFLNDEYFQVAESAYPGAIPLHLEGIEGDCNGQHVKCWVFFLRMYGFPISPKKQQYPISKIPTENSWTVKYPKTK